MGAGGRALWCGAVVGAGLFPVSADDADYYKLNKQVSIAY